VLFRSQKAAAIAASCNILPMNQELFQVGAYVCGGRGGEGIDLQVTTQGYLCMMRGFTVQVSGQSHRRQQRMVVLT